MDNSEAVDRITERYLALLEQQRLILEDNKLINNVLLSAEARIKIAHKDFIKQINAKPETTSGPCSKTTGNRLFHEYGKKRVLNENKQ